MGLKLTSVLLIMRRLLGPQDLLGPMAIADASWFHSYSKQCLNGCFATSHPTRVTLPPPTSYASTCPVAKLAWNHTVSLLKIIKKVPEIIRHSSAPYYIYVEIQLAVSYKVSHVNVNKQHFHYVMTVSSFVYSFKLSRQTFKININFLEMSLEILSDNSVDFQ